ncbi:MAG: spore cortex-lytic protein [Oscillospiraceae bacterium]|nr:spore cortex-lytic protein [Oscillospiraceae bacterium]
MNGEPYIPQFLTVHLGAPGSNAQNVTVSFPDYIKNVASSEIYPTWPENAIRANVYAQISYALNRYYTEWYRSMGYDFDITNSTRYDQAYVQNRDIFANISDIVDDIFNEYVYRQGSVEPYFTQYCNGTTVTCDGLSQWGTVPLAEQGYGPYDILVEFYGPDINLNTDTPVRINSPSYPGLPLRLGDAGNSVRTKQVQLNSISRNYPSIPKIAPVDGVFGQETDDAVREFQRIFKLTADGIIGKATWYRIAYLYNSVKRLSELDSEGISLDEVAQQFPSLLSPGDTGDEVRMIQYYLQVVAAYYDTVPPLTTTGVYDDATYQAVMAFQRTFGLTPDGIMGQQTWNELYKAYRGILDSTAVMEGGVVLYPGTVLRIGSQGEYVQILQEYLAYISEFYPEIPAVQVTGVFGNQTQAAVIAFQNLFGLEAAGIVGPLTWDAIASLYSDLRVGNDKQPGQFPGTELAEGETT